MRKLLVVLLALVVGVFLYAENVTVSWSGSANFTLTVDENGVDVDGGANVTVAWAPNGFSAAAGKVSASFGLGCCGGAAFGGITFDGNIVKISYVPGAASLGSYLFTGKDNDGDGALDGVGTDYAAVTLKALDFLELYYVDIVGETNLNAGAPAEASYFDDFVGVKLAKDLGVFGLTAYGAFYDTDAVGASNNYEYAAEVSLAGEGSLENLSVWVGFGNSVAAGTAYGLTAGYSFNLKAGMISIGVNPSVKYSENLSKLVFSSFGDGKSVSAVVSVGLDMSPVSVSAEVDPKYDLAASTFAMPANASLSVSAAPVTASAAFNVTDVMNFAGGWNVNGNVTADVAPVNVAANILYKNTGDFGYNASVSYTVEEGLTASAFYGTLYNAGAGEDIQPNAQWYAQLSYSMSF